MRFWPLALRLPSVPARKARHRRWYTLGYILYLPSCSGVRDSNHSWSRFS